MNVSFILLLVLGLAGCGMLIVGLVLVVWAIMQDRKSSQRQ
jgi:hypothetical protein